MSQKITFAVKNAKIYVGIAEPYHNNDKVIRLVGLSTSEHRSFCEQKLGVRPELLQNKSVSVEPQVVFDNYLDAETESKTQFVNQQGANSMAFQFIR